MAVKRRPKPLLIFLVALGSFLILIASVYLFLASPVNANNKDKIEVVVPSGTGVSGISDILKEKKLIRSKLLFMLQVKTTKDLYLKASTYQFSQDMSMSEIIKELTSGNSYNPDVITITFKEGERITDYITDIATATSHTPEEIREVINDHDYLEELIRKYWFLTDTILNKAIYYPLEGYLAPDTYQFKDKDVSISTIVETMLDHMEKQLSSYRGKIGHDVSYYVTMASMLELEGTNTKNRKMIAGIFENRLAAKMNLGSDVTTYYALQYPMTSDLTTAQFATVNPYNTRSTTMAGKMPIGPICNPSLSSLKASIAPTNSDNLYFVADKNGNIYYTKTLAEHEKKVQEIKDKGDWIW